MRCWPSGRLAVIIAPRIEDMTTEAMKKFRVRNAEYDIHLPEKVKADTARTMLTSHGQLHMVVSRDREAD